MSVPCKKHIETPYRGYCPCVACELEKKDELIARLKAELAEAQYDGRNALGLRLLLKPGEWKRRMESEPDADTRDLGQDVAMLVLLMRNQRRELADLRRKVGEWADEVDALDDCMADGIVSAMREEAGK